MEFKITIILSHIENQSVEDMSLNAVNYIKEFIEDDELNIESIEDITELSSGTLDYVEYRAKKDNFADRLYDHEKARADMLEQENAKLTNDIKMYQEKVGKLRRTISEDMNVRLEVFKDATDQDLREELKLRGYYVDNLWSTHDVSQNYNVTETEAQEILDEAMTSEYITGEVFTSIDEIAHSRGIKKVIDSQEFTDDDVKKYQSDAWAEAQRDSGDEG